MSEDQQPVTNEVDCDRKDTGNHRQSCIAGFTDSRSDALRQSKWNKTDSHDPNICGCIVHCSRNICTRVAFRSHEHADEAVAEHQKYQNSCG